jgi:ribosomal protein S12 methylthiotransferase accessory factor
MEMNISLPGGKRVDANFKGFTIKTDQPKDEGGENSALTPFDLFLVSVGTCTGFYVMSFCQERNIPADTITLKMEYEWNNTTHHVDDIAIKILLPTDFPKKYKNAVIKSAESCTVKKHLAIPPNIHIDAETV